MRLAVRSPGGPLRPLARLHTVLNEEWAHHGFCVREPVRLGRMQCDDLLDELAFVALLLNDPLAVQMAHALHVRRRQSASSGEEA